VRNDLINGPIDLLIGICLLATVPLFLFLAVRYGLRGFEFTKKDLKNAGFNRPQRRQFRSRSRRKRQPRAFRYWDYPLMASLALR